MVCFKKISSNSISSPFCNQIFCEACDDVTHGAIQYTQTMGRCIWQMPFRHLGKHASSKTNFHPKHRWGWSASCRFTQIDHVSGNAPVMAEAETLACTAGNLILGWTLETNVRKNNFTKLKYIFAFQIG